MKRLLLLALLWPFVASAQNISQANWKLVFADSANASYPATNAFDGNSATMWHTEWQGTAPPQPHEIQIDLGAVYNVTGFSYLPRQDGNYNGVVGQYNFYVSSDLTKPWTLVSNGSWSVDFTLKTVAFVSTVARYVRFQSLAAGGNGNFTSAAEINVSGTLNSPVNIVTFTFPVQLTTCTKCDGTDDQGAAALGLLAGSSITISSGTSTVCSGVLNANAQMSCSAGIDISPAMIPLSLTVVSGDGSTSYTDSQQILGILFMGRNVINVVALFDSANLQPRGLRVWTQ